MDESFHYLIMAEHSLLQKGLLTMLKGSGLSAGQPKILDYLLTHNGAAQKEIARGCHIEPGTLTTLLNRMEENGLVERRMQKGNRRTYHIFMTAEGKRQALFVMENFHKLENNAFHGISDAEKKAFMKTLLQIYDNLNI